MKLKFKLAIIGAQKIRVAKVVSLLDNCQLQNDETVEKIYMSLRTSQSGDSAVRYTFTSVEVEYIPCVASFGFYENENGQAVRYLNKLDYHGRDGMDKGSSLSPFLDDIDGISSTTRDESVVSIPGISIWAIGCGIESDQDVIMIRNFVETITNTNLQETDEDKSTIFEFIQPNPEFASMQEENLHYKNLTIEEKEKVTATQFLGPGKMVKFIHSLEKQFIDLRRSSPTVQSSQNINDEIGCSNNYDEKKESPDMLQYNDSTKTRYACKICRTILFNQDNLENPPHSKHQHEFSNRKTKSVTSSKCESVFLASELDWMPTTADIEGKLSCPKCDAKLGLWKWVGSQCSCGTWVTPAIQVYSKRVDVISPILESESCIQSYIFQNNHG